MKPVNQSKQLFKGAFILAIAALVTKILSAVYRIPFQNIVGDVGFYIYQQVYPFYGIAIVLATTGFPVVISKLYAELQERGDKEKSQRLLFLSFIFLQFIGLVCFIALYTGADKIAWWMKDIHLAILIKVVSLVFLTFPVVSILRGYYQGKGDMMPTALSQIGEQIIRVLTILLLAYILIQNGSSLYLIGGGAMFGAVTGSIVSACILFTFLWLRKEWEIIAPRRGEFSQYRLEAKLVFKALLFQGLTICISGALMIFIQLADSLNLYSLLLSNDYESTVAKELKGIFDRGQPLIQLGTVMATAMSLSLVLLISSARLKQDPAFLHDKVSISVRVSLVIGLGASAGLWAIIAPTNTMLFENEQGSAVLGVLSTVILFSSFITTIIAIMQGMGFFLVPALVVLAAFPIKYILNMFLVPLLDTMGAAYATVATLVLVSIILYLMFKRIMNIKLFTLSFIQTVLLGTIIMSIFLKGYLVVTDSFLFPFSSQRLNAALQAVSAVFFGGILFLFIIIRGNVFKERELTLFPFGSKLSLFISRKKRS